MADQDAVTTRPVTAGSFEDFFRTYYRPLVKQVRYAGADMTGAEDAVVDTMTDVYLNWVRLEDPAAWARRAVVRFFLKAKTRHLGRLRAEQHRHDATRIDGGLTTWEEWQWIKQLLLELLTPGQRQVMALVMDGYTPTEIATKINIKPDAVRQRLRLAREVLADALRERRDTEPGALPETRP